MTIVEDLTFSCGNISNKFVNIKSPGKFIGIIKLLLGTPLKFLRI